MTLNKQLKNVYVKGLLKAYCKGCSCQTKEVMFILSHHAPVCPFKVKEAMDIVNWEAGKTHETLYPQLFNFGMVIPVRHNNSKTVLEICISYRDVVDTRWKVYTNLCAYFQNSAFLIVQTALFLMFTYSDTNLLHFSVCCIALHVVMPTKKHHHGTRLISVH
jgi:hypothetical protein